MNTRDISLENTQTNKPSNLPIADVQSTIDTRHIAIQSVGIRSVKYPVLIELQGQKPMPSVAEFEMTVFLPADQKGTHMSRFIALLEESQGKVLTVGSFRSMLLNMLQLLVHYFDDPAR